MSSPRRGSSIGGDDDATSDGSGGGSNKTAIICRVRCFNGREIALQDESNAGLAEYDKKPLRSVVEMEGSRGDTVFLDHHNNYAERQRFPFDYSYWSIPPAQQDPGKNNIIQQEDIYRDIGTQIIDNAFKAVNSCIFAYGQTGSGKTYSMMGTETDPGLIPRICKGLFDRLEKTRAEAAANAEEGMIKEFRLEARFFEIYNEKVKDLLWALRPADVPEDPNIDKENIRVRHVGSEIQLVGLTHVNVGNVEDCLRLIDEGTRNRSVGATKMNDQSSRSHSIFRLTLVQTIRVLPKDKFDKPKTYHRTAITSLVDLAGSERMKKTGAEGQRLKEAVAINQSLTTLKNVIDALVEGRAVVPYRDSTLTWILSDNLGGNSKTFMIACVSPHLDNADETLNTLRYALRTQSIVNQVHVNESDELKRMNKMKDELARLQAEYAEGAGDSEYVALKQKQQELREAAARSRERAEAAAKAEAAIRVRLDLARRQRYNLAYRAAFHRVFSKRADLEFTGYFARDSATLAGLRREVDNYNRDATSTDKEISDLRAEERRTQSALRTSEAELLRQKDRLESAQAALRDLDRMEAENSDKIIHMQARLPSTENIAKQFVHRKLLSISVERERAVRTNTAVLDAIKEEHRGEIEAMRAERAKKLEPLAEQQQRIAGRGKKDEADHKKMLEDLKAKMTKLQSNCVFVENENRRSQTEVDEAILQMNKERYEKFSTMEAAGKKRLQEYQASSKAALAAKMEELRLALSEEQSRHETAMDKAMERCRDEVMKINRAAEVEAAATLEECKSKLHRFQNLNADASSVLRSARAAQKRYADMHGAIMAVLRGTEPPEINTAEEMDALEDLLKRLQRGVELATGSPSRSTSAGGGLQSPTSPSSTPKTGKNKQQQQQQQFHAPPPDVISPNYQHVSQTPLAFRTNVTSPSDRTSHAGHSRGTPNRGTRSGSRTPSLTPSHNISMSSSRVPALSTAVSDARSRQHGPVTPNRSVARSVSQQQQLGLLPASQHGVPQVTVRSPSSTTRDSLSHVDPLASPPVLRRKPPPVYQTATSKLRSAYAKHDKIVQQALKEEEERMGCNVPFQPYTGHSSTPRGGGGGGNNTPNRRGGTPTRSHTPVQSARGQQSQDQQQDQQQPQPWNREENWYGFKSVASNEEAIPCSQRVVIEGSVIAMRTHTVVGTPRSASKQHRSVTPSRTVTTPRGISPRR